MNEILKAIEERRSVRRYKNETPSEELIDQVIEAGLNAASGRNLQGAIILAVTNKEIRDRLSADNAAVMGASSDPFYGAPAVLVVLADRSVRTSVYDGSLVAGNIMLAAHSLGLGCCWIHRAKEVFDMPVWREYLRSLGIEGEYEGVANMILGYPDGSYPDPKPRLPGRSVKVK
ncbi:MAG: nitroreductase [Clostridia bacterium]|nr:nitroreductase [Clostridia bacterium]